LIFFLTFQTTFVYRYVDLLKNIESDAKFFSPNP